MARLSCHPRSAFTLIELVLMLALMALLMAAVAPQFRGFGQGQKVENAADDLLAATRFARTEAIATAVPHRLDVADDGSAFWVSRLEGTVYEPVAGDFGRGEALAEAIRVELVLQDGSGAAVVDFYPTGHLTPARVTVTNNQGRTITLSAVGIADSFRRQKRGGR